MDENVLKEKIVSVIMPAYNEEKYIAEAIESIINQTYPNWELIIVDDCSKDRTVEIIKQYMAREKRIRLYCQPENKGACAALNEALRKISEGGYACWLSADDKYKPEMFRSSIHYLETHPKMQAVFSKHEFIHEDTAAIEAWEYPASYLHIGEPGCKEPYWTIAHRNAFNACTVFAATDSFRKAGFFNLSHSYAGDYDYMLRLCAYSDIGFLNQVNVESRVHPEQVSAEGRNEIDAVHVYGEMLLNDNVRKRLFVKAGIKDTRENIIALLRTKATEYAISGFMKETEECKNVMKKVLTEFPQIVQADRHCRKISNCMEQQQWEEAERLLVKETPEEIKHFVNNEVWGILVANILDHKGNYAQEREILEDILKVNADNYEAEYMLGSTYEKQGENLPALGHYAAATVKSRDAADYPIMAANLKRFVNENL